MLRRSVTRRLQRHSSIVHYPHSLLTTPAAHVTENDRKSLLGLQLRRMLDVASEVHALSLSAPKVKWDARVIILRSGPDKDQYEVFVNPTAPGYAESQTSIAPMYGFWENCISCAVCSAWVIRPQAIAVEYQDEWGNTKNEVLTSMRARLFMHEMDHLDGMTILQRVPSPEFVVSVGALNQKHQWDPTQPSIEAHMTPENRLFNYVTNETEVPRGFEWVDQMQTAFNDAKAKEIEQEDQRRRQAQGFQGWGKPLHSA